MSWTDWCCPWRSARAAAGSVFSAGASDGRGSWTCLLPGVLRSSLTGGFSLPNTASGIPLADGWPVIHQISSRSRTSSTWKDMPKRHSPHTTCCNHFARWCKASVWERFLAAASQALDGDLIMIYSSSIKVHRDRAILKRGPICRIGCSR